ncbi:hypothetical protein [Phenylobacterium sp.]|uniref:hypothetical protein n=1 Tax=Phenylobacterium sp. TaxID=1871053 RepID=UPI002CB5A6A9|nr:hypothetical protein [Phenylobacterium sp.]HLZ73442.1 hypothetical protein [Phenylobacterium sp.]
MSHLQIASDAPVLIRAAAGAVLYSHIGGGVLGLASGAVALAARKGGPVHRAAGNVFFAAMLTMAGIGAVVSPMLQDYGSAFGGAITFYLVLTGWLAGRSAQVKGGALETGGVVVLACGMVMIGLLGRQALVSPDHALAGVPWFAYFVMGAIAGLVAVTDLRVILGPVLTRPRRLTRHIWRMGLALFIALMSALAQPKAGGLLFHGPTVNLQWIPVAALVLTIAYWLVRTQRAGQRKSPKANRGAAGPALEVMS